MNRRQRILQPLRREKEMTENEKFVKGMLLEMAQKAVAIAKEKAAADKNPRTAYLASAAAGAAALAKYQDEYKDPVERVWILVKDSLYYAAEAVNGPE